MAIGTAVSLTGLVHFFSTRLGASEGLARAVVLVAAAALAAQLVFGIFRIAGGLGLALADRALPNARRGKADLADAPRRALVVTVQLGMVLLVGLPVLALTQPFVSIWVAAGTLGALLLLLGVLFWRSATNLQGHVKAGAQVIVEALAAQARRREPPDGAALDGVNALLPGLGTPVPLRLDAGSPAVGKTPAQLGVRGVTGASVLAIARGDAGVMVPSAGELLQAGDILALAGTSEAVAAAVELLTRPAPREAGAIDEIGERPVAP